MVVAMSRYSEIRRSSLVTRIGDSSLETTDTEEITDTPSHLLDPLRWVLEPIRVWGPHLRLVTLCRLGSLFNGHEEDGVRVGVGSRGCISLK